MRLRWDPGDADVSGYYAIDNAGSYKQWRSPRRAPISGVVVVHNTDSALDRIAPDRGAENVAGWIVRDPNPHSYHELYDTDSTVVMLPDDVECFGVETGDNRHAWQCAFAAKTADFVPDDMATLTMFARAAVGIVGFWTRNGFDPAECNRWLDYHQAHDLRWPGLVHHGVLQPYNRSDAWSNDADRPALDDRLQRAISAYIGLHPEPAPRRDRYMATNLILSNADGRGEEFDIDHEGRLRQRWQGAPNGGWSPWRPFPLPIDGAISEVSGFRNADGRLEIKVTNKQYGFAVRAWQKTPGIDPWVGWYAA